MKKLVPTVLAALAVVGLSAQPVAAKPAHAGKRAKAHKLSKSKKCRKLHAVGFSVRGSLAGYDAASVTLEVGEANKHARVYLAANPPTFATAGASLRFEGVTDADGDGVGLEDVVSTDRVEVVGKLVQPKKGCAGETSLSVRRVVVTREAVEPEPEPVA